MSIFTQIKSRKPKRTAFNLSHNYKMTGRMGILYPIFCQDVLPGDTFKLNTEIFMRMQPLRAPMMSRVRIYTHYFFVPKRLLWSGWREFITGASQSKSRKDIDDFVPPEYPRFKFATTFVDSVHNGTTGGFPFTEGTLADYLGFPVYDRADQDGRVDSAEFNIVDALPFRAYNLIWNEYYRDENLEDEVDIQYESSGVSHFKGVADVSWGLNSPLTKLHRRAWKKDYFTSALPFAQAGPDVELPLTNTMGDDFTLPVSLNRSLMMGMTTGVYDHLNQPLDANFGLASQDGFVVNPNNTTSDPDHYPKLLLDDPSNPTRTPYELNNETLKSLYSNIGSATINELRRAFAAQRFLEANARGGSRYIEQLYSIFGVKSSDARLQRPEYLGGGVQDIVVSDVLQTSATDQTSPQANQAGIGVSLGRSGGFKRFFEEHGYVIGIMSVLPDASYQQGMPRQYMKFDRFDHYWPQFAHLGEQEIKNSELFYDGLDSSYNDFESDGTFGYTPRYAEYKFIPSTVHGDFRTNLNFWHLGRIFNERPNLNATFIGSDPRSGIFAVEQDVSDPLLFNIQHHLKAVRPMPRFGTPH